jgi:hypothetical protein
MSDASKAGGSAGQTTKSAGSRSRSAAEIPPRLFLIAYPKIVFLYPTLLVSLIAAIYLSLVGQSLDEAHTGAIVLSAVFLSVLALNLLILTFDFPRTTSLTLFFLVVALATGCTLLVVLKPELLPEATSVLERFRPVANATFYWTFTVILGVLMVAAIISARLDRWEVRANELLHREGIWGNLRRFPVTGLRIDKEMNDVFEYLLLRSGRLILHPSNERQAIVLDNVPLIKRKEEILTRMLGAMEVEIRARNGSTE